MNLPVFIEPGLSVYRGQHLDVAVAAMEIGDRRSAYLAMLCDYSVANSGGFRRTLTQEPRPRFWPVEDSIEVRLMGGAQVIVCQLTEEVPDLAAV